VSGDGGKEKLKADKEDEMIEYCLKHRETGGGQSDSEGSKRAETSSTRGLRHQKNEKRRVNRSAESGSARRSKKMEGRRRRVAGREERSEAAGKRKTLKRENAIQRGGPSFYFSQNRRSPKERTIRSTGGAEI